MRTVKLLAAITISALCAAPAVYAAQSAYPEKPIRLVIGSAPGSGPDIISRALADRLPHEAAGLEKEDLRGCFEKFPPESELSDLEARLRTIESGGGLTRESRQRLYTLLVAARATRLLLEGQTEEEAGRSVRPDLENLRRFGGAVDPDCFGPRVRRIYDSLR